ncbi:MAG: hypothetical protein CFE43_18845 [Burkholderiales bacterium PBB3]|nr:MAG: hypothetical protein CFE43_18845 [Burkholderiales bacterium PBB3]
MAESTPLNIRQFNILVLLILSSLYQSFPKLRVLSLNNLAAEATPDDTTYDESLDWIDAANAAADWLREEGFIRFERRVHIHTRPGEIEDARLSLQGLTILGFVPKSLSLKPRWNREVLIDRIQHALSSGAKRAGTEAVTALTKELIQLALKSTP